MAKQEKEKPTSKRTEKIVPKPLTYKLMSYIVPNIGRVLITDFEQYGDSLFDVIKEHPDTYFMLTTVNATKLKDVYKKIDNVNIMTADTCEHSFIDETFDLIISVPAFGGRLLARDDSFICRETDLAALQNLIGHLNDDGKLTIVLPAKITFGGGSVAQLRKYIENSFSILEIDILPETLFLPYTAIRTYLFVFLSGDTDSVLLRQYVPDVTIGRNNPCNELILQKEIMLPKDEVEKPNGWYVEQAISEETEEEKAYDASSIQKVMIKDVAKVFRGKAVNTKTKDGSIGVISISDITDMGIDYAHVDRINVEENKIQKYLLEDGDVLVSTRGTSVKVAVVKDAPILCIPSVNLIVIRPNKMIRGTYLKLFLESPVGMQMLKSLQRGGSVLNINYRDVESLEIPAPPIKTQDTLIEKYDAGLKVYKDAISKAEKKWNKIRQEVQSELF